MNTTCPKCGNTDNVSKWVETLGCRECRNANRAACRTYANTQRLNREAEQATRAATAKKLLAHAITAGA